VRRFLAWAQRADAGDRAEAASALARACLHAEFTAVERKECVLVLTALLDDPAIAVRRALAEAFAGSRRAPRALVVALAGDVSEVSAPLLARSPLLTDAELVDAVATGDEVAQCAVARRASLGPGPAGAVAEVGAHAAGLALIDNASAALTPGALRRVMERFAGDVEIRRAMVARPNLPAALKAEIAIATAGALRTPSRGLARRRADRDAVLTAIAAHCPAGERAELVRTLRAPGALTTALLLRALLGGDRALLIAALAELADLPLERAAGFVSNAPGVGFAAAAAKAGLPAPALPVFRAALRALAKLGAGPGEGLKARLVEAVIASCERENDPALASYLALLWRFAAEAARADARRAIDKQSLPPKLDFAPANDDPSATGVAPPTFSIRGADLTEVEAPLVELPPDLVLALDAA
jgi:uncharacterized protein (DUF2336 family)